MAASAIIALISTATAVATTAGGIAAFSFLGLTGFAAVATSFLVSTAMGAALNALAPKPSLGGSRGYSIAGESGAALDHQIIYGEARVGGVRVYDASTGTNNEFLHRIMAFAGHEVDSYQQIYLNDEVVTLDGSGNVTSPSRYNGFVRIKRYFGTTTQTADADLVSETASLATDAGRWTSDHRLQGIAYLYVRFKYNADAFPNGIPAVSATIRGKKVFDPRTSTTAWSNNPALCLRDYITSDYGLAQPSGSIEDNLVEDAADWCDDTVDGEKRYTCNGSFITSFEPNQILSDMLTSMGGLLWYSQGKWRIKAAKYTTPTVTFDENDLRSGISLSTRHSRRSNFNTVKGKFRGSESDWQEADYPVVSDPAFVSADNGVVNTLDFPLPFTTSSKTAQRIANIALRRNREQLTFSASFGLKAFQVDVGDFVYINNTRFGWSNKAFEVTNWTFGLTDGLDLQVQMTLREISSAVFTDEAASVFEQNNTTLPDPFTGFSVTNLVASGGGRTQSDGTFVESALLNWDAVSNSFLDYYEVQWRPLSDSVYSSTTTKLNSIEITPIVDDVEYLFRVRAVSAGGVKGAFATVQFTGGGDTTAPGLPTSITATGHFEYIALRWTNPTNSDFSHVEVWENTSNTTTGATRVGIAAGNSFQRTNLGLNVTRWYFLKSVDYSGNASAFTSGVSATTTFIDDADFANGVYSLFTSQGLYAIKDVTSLPLSGAFTGEKVYNRTDGKLYQWTGSAWVLVIADVAAGSITETKIANDAITTPKIAANAVTAAEIAANTITGDRIVANTITGGLLATSGIITSSAQINNAVIQSANIQNLAVGRIKIANGAITNKGSIANSWSFSQPVNTGVYGSTSFPPVGSFPTSSFILIGQQTYTVPTDAPSSISFEVGLTIVLLYSLLSTAPAANHENGWWHHLRIEDSSGNLIQGSTYPLVQQYQSNGYVVFTPNHRTFGVQVPALFLTTNYVAGQVLTFKNYFYRYRSSTAYGLGLNSTGGLIQYEEFYK
jgi:Fibronectin type III domain.